MAADNDDALLAYRMKEATRLLDTLSGTVNDDMELALLFPVMYAMHLARTFDDVDRSTFNSMISRIYDMYITFKNVI